MRRSTSAVLAFLLAMLVAGSSAYGGSAHRIRVPTCSTAVAGGPSLASADPTLTHLGGEPFGVAATRGYAFVANLGSGLDVLADHDSPPHLIHAVGLRGGQPLGVTLTADGRYLLMADGGDGAYVIDVARAEAGAKGALLGTLSGRQSQGGGAIEVAASRDGRYAFVSLEGSGQIAVYRLADAISQHFSKSTYVGAIPAGIAPVGLAVSPNGRWLYSTSEVGRPGTRGGGSGEVGSLSVISISSAEHDPAKSVVASTSAGCNPVRVVVSSNGRNVWVTARASDDLLAFSASRLVADAKQAELASVRVGEAPVGLALVDHDTRVIVADSNRFDAPGSHSELTVVSTKSALAHRPAIIGTVRAGLFPREMALEPAGTVLLVGNFGSGTLESLHVAALAQETRRRRAKPRGDD
jgi:DNA-binding beta-propeller fold protein YncE